MRFSAAAPLAFIMAVSGCSGIGYVRNEIVPVAAGTMSIRADVSEIVLDSFDRVPEFSVVVSNRTAREVRLIRYRASQKLTGGMERQTAMTSIPVKLKPGETLTVKDTAEASGDGMQSALALGDSDSWTGIRSIDYADSDGATNTERTEFCVRLVSSKPTLEILESAHFRWFVDRNSLNSLESRNKLVEMTNWMEWVYAFCDARVGVNPADTDKAPVTLIRHAPLIPSGFQVGYTTMDFGKPFISVAWEAVDTPGYWWFGVGDAWKGLGRYVMAHEYVHYRLLSLVPKPPYWFVEPPAILLGVRALEVSGEREMAVRTRDRMARFSKAFRERGMDPKALFSASMADYPRLNGSKESDLYYGYIEEMLTGIEMAAGSDFLRLALEKLLPAYQALSDREKADPKALNPLFRRAFTEIGGKDAARILDDFGFPGAEIRSNQ